MLKDITNDDNVQYNNDDTSTIYVILLLCYIIYVSKVPGRSLI